jgi:hypothetical protein
MQSFPTIRTNQLSVEFGQSWLPRIVEDKDGIDHVCNSPFLGNIDLLSILFFAMMMFSGAGRRSRYNMAKD